MGGGGHEEWLTFAAKGELSADGSSNASLAGFICSSAGSPDEKYPVIKLLRHQPARVLSIRLSAVH